MAVAAQGSVLPYSAWPYGHHDAWSHSGVHYGAHYASPAITQYASLPYHAAVHAPAVSYAHHVAAPVYHHDHHYEHAPLAHHVAAHGATYTAATRGAVHTAPLPGHIASQTSFNVQAAPGTY